jgi:hypothetical protein
MVRQASAAAPYERPSLVGAVGDATPREILTGGEIRVSCAQTINAVRVRVNRSRRFFPALPRARDQLPAAPCARADMVNWGGRRPESAITGPTSSCYLLRFWGEVRIFALSPRLPHAGTGPLLSSQTDRSQNFHTFSTERALLHSYDHLLVRDLCAAPSSAVRRLFLCASLLVAITPFRSALFPQDCVPYVWLNRCLSPYRSTQKDPGGPTLHHADVLSNAGSCPCLRATSHCLPPAL